MLSQPGAAMDPNMLAEHLAKLGPPPEIPVWQSPQQGVAAAMSGVPGPQPPAGGPTPPPAVAPPTNPQTGGMLQKLLGGLTQRPAGGGQNRLGAIGQALQGL